MIPEVSQFLLNEKSPHRGAHCFGVIDKSPTAMSCRDLEICRILLLSCTRPLRYIFLRKFGNAPA